MMQIRQEESSFQRHFQRSTIAEQGLRLDGRNLTDCREVEIFLNRSDKQSRAEVTLGNTRCVCTVRGEIVAPYMDRPTEGMLQFNTSLSPATEAAGHNSHEITRLLERSIRESDAIDTESLCIVSNERVWLITCDIRIIDYDGNAIDTASLAALAALRAFRRPEVSVMLSTEFGTIVTTHTSEERDPLPLALHHSPLAVTYGVLQIDTKAGEQVNINNSNNNSSGNTLLVSDCSASEEASLDGTLICCVNSHNELCAINMPGKVGIPSQLLINGTKNSLIRAKYLHKIIDISLQNLDNRKDYEIKSKLFSMQKKIEIKMNSNSNSNSNDNDNEMDVTKSSTSTNANANVGGIDKNDEMLSWNLLHVAAGLPEDKEK